MQLSVRGRSIWWAAVLSGGLISGCTGVEGDDDSNPGASPTPAGGLAEFCASVSELEPNDSSGTASAVPGIDSSTCTRLDGGDQDYYRLEVPESFGICKLSLEVLDQDGTCFFDLDPYLQLLAEDGQTVLYDQEDSFADYCPRLTFEPEPGATYYLRIASRYGMEGLYALNVRRGGGGTISGQASVSVEAQRQRTFKRAGQAADPPSSAMAGELLIEPQPGLSLPDLELRLRRATLLADVSTLSKLAASSDPTAPSNLSASSNLTALGNSSALRELSPRLGGRYVLTRFSMPDALPTRDRMAWTSALRERVRALPGVREVHWNRRFQAQVIPDDSEFSSQWDLGSPPGMNLIDAWGISQGSSSAIVGVIDTGNDPDHPDLVGKFVVGYDFISDPSNSSDGDGVDADPVDSAQQSHGAHVAGTIAANTDNGVGIAGLGWNTRYMPLRVCGAAYGCTEADIAEAMWHGLGYETVAGPGLATPRVQVINLSVGGHDLCSPPMQAVIDAAVARGVVVAVAAGNESDDAGLYSPASCAGVLTVGASNQSAARASFSNYGSAVDIMAPGTEILSTVDGGGYSAWNGTSMATPHIAGLAALLKGMNPSFGFDRIYALITSTAGVFRCDAGSDGCGAGLADAEAALLAASSLTETVDALPGSLLVTATLESDATQEVYTVSLDGSFVLSDVPAGRWIVRAGIDLNGNRHLDPESETLSTWSEVVEIDACGEDIAGIELVVGGL